MTNPIAISKFFYPITSNEPFYVNKMKYPTHNRGLDKRKLVFLAQGIYSPMFQIQSLPYLEVLKKEYDIIIISLEENLSINQNSEKFMEIRKKLEDNYRLEVINFWNVPFIPKIIGQIIQLMPQLLFKAKRNRYYYFHARGYLPAILLHYVKKLSAIKYIFDMRGVVVDELKLVQNLNEKDFKVKIWRRLEKKAVISSDFCIVVSKPFAEYVKNINPNKDIYIIKNSVVKDVLKENEYKNIRHKVRDQMGLRRKKVWVYSGSTYKWQQIPIMISLFKFACEMEDNLYFLIISRDNVEEIEKIFKDSGIPANFYKIISVEQNHVKNYLIASDVGILLRERSVINKVSDPLKFVEYLHAGLLVILTKEIGDTEEIVIRNDLGIVLNSFKKSDFIKSINSLNNLLQNRNPIKIIQIADRVYNFNQSLQQYKNSWQRLIS